MCQRESGEKPNYVVLCIEKHNVGAHAHKLSVHSSTLVASCPPDTSLHHVYYCLLMPDLLFLSAASEDQWCDVTTSRAFFFIDMLFW